MIAAIPSAVVVGVDGRLVSVEVHVSNGLPGFTVVGLPDAAVRESRDRVHAALLSSGLTWPRRRITVNLAPSGMRKGGAGLDLPVALGVLVASGALRADAVAGCGFVGELGLDGSLRGVPGTMVLGEALRDLRIVVPEDSAPEVSVIPGARIATAATLAGLVARLRSRTPWPDRPAAAPHRVPGRARTRTGRPRGRAWSAPRPARPRGGGCGRSPPAHGGPARLGQVDACQPVGRSAARPRPPDRPRRHPRPLCGRPPPPAGRAPHPPGVSRAPSRSVSGGDDRRRPEGKPPGGDQPGPRRRPVPRRARGVPGGGPGRAPPTARGRSGAGEPGRRHDHIPGPVPTRRSHEPVPLR